MNEAQKSKVLCVDDEPSILEAFRRQLRNQFDLEVAIGAKQGLRLISERGPFAVIVSDMRMPEMNGIDFLREVKRLSPDSVRVMLTGNSDQETAARAVNEGNIFRFLAKPCSAEDLSQTLSDAREQYRLITAERDLLQNTLSGSVKLLTDILSLVDPVSFGENIKLRETIRLIAKPLGIANSWDIELAAMLSNIGLVTVPSTVIAKLHKGDSLIAAEQEMIEKVPAVGHSLICNIPRLEGIAKLVLFQNKHFDGTGIPSDESSGESIPIGARVIKVVKDLCQLEKQQISRRQALEMMAARKGCYDPHILHIMMQLFAPDNLTTPAPQELARYSVKSHQLFVGQVLLSNVETIDGVLLISSGVRITETLLERLNNYSKFIGIKEPIYVDCLIPAGI